MRTKKIAGLAWLVVVVLIALGGMAAAENQKIVSVEKININTASADTLMQLNGIGRSYAKRIIEYREKHGLFSHIEEIKNVKGIGDKIFEKIRNRITVEVKTSNAADRSSR